VRPQIHRQLTAEEFFWLAASDYKELIDGEPIPMTPALVQEKVDEYVAAGARLVWVVDPQSGKLTVHRPSGPPSVLGPADDLEGEDVLPGFRHPLSRFLGS
jgi:Uma2 family endonuclease